MLNENVARRGLMFVLSSPSGAGKSTLARKLIEEDANMSLSVSATTRPRRPSEIDGREYKFNVYSQRGRGGYSYRQSFKTKKDEWIEVELPVEKFVASFASTHSCEASGKTFVGNKGYDCGQHAASVASVAEMVPSRVARAISVALHCQSGVVSGMFPPFGPTRSVPRKQLAVLAGFCGRIIVPVPPSARRSRSLLPRIARNPAGHTSLIPETRSSKS